MTPPNSQRVFEAVDLQGFNVNYRVHGKVLQQRYTDGSWFPVPEFVNFEDFSYSELRAIADCIEDGKQKEVKA